MPRVFQIGDMIQSFPVNHDGVGADGDLVVKALTGEIRRNIGGTWTSLEVPGPTPLIQTTPASAAEQFGVFTYGDLSGVSGAVTFSHSHSIAGFDIESSTLITSLSWPNLIDVDPSNTQGGYLSLQDNSALTSVSLPQLAHTGGFFGIQNSALLTSLSLPLLVSSGGDFQIQTNGIVTLSIPSYVPRNGQSILFGTNALSAASVNHILSRCVANAAYVSGTVYMAGGTSAAPTGQGIADKATLVGRGVTVTTN